MNPYSVLGVSNTATVEEAKAAFRRLASKHHPDKGGRTEKFQEIQAAIAMIESGKYTAFIDTTKTETKYHKSWSRPENVYDFDRGKSYAEYQKNGPSSTPKPKSAETIIEGYLNGDGSVLAYVSIVQAFNGYTCMFTYRNKTYRVKVPPRSPNGLKYLVNVDGGTVIVYSKFMQSEFQSIPVESASKVENTNGDKILCTDTLRTEINLYRQDIKYRYSHELIDIDGTKFKVEIPANPTSGIEITVPNRGYYRWNQSTSTAEPGRGPLIVKVHVTEKTRATIFERW